MSKLFELIAKLPERYELRARMEHEVEHEDGEGHRDYLTAVIMEEAPDGGWPDEPSVKYAYDARAHVGISALDAETAERLTIGMLESFLAKVT